MLPKTMERLVGSQAWLKEGVIPKGDFSEAAKSFKHIWMVSPKKKEGYHCTLVFSSFSFYLLYTIKIVSLSSILSSIFSKEALCLSILNQYQRYIAPLPQYSGCIARSAIMLNIAPLAHRNLR